MPIRTVAIVGVGLIGGSFALALRKAGFSGRVVGVSRQATLEEAQRLGVVDEGASLEDGLAEADLVFLAQPILRILDQLSDVARFAKPGALVTDAGSTKAAIVNKAEEVFGSEQARFLGGHPMAGKEGRGVAIAEAELFEGAVWALTPNPELPPSEFESEFRQWVERIGARTLELSPEEHDRVTALTSHVPQLASSALSAAVWKHIADPDKLAVAGGGLRDMSRLAGSSYEIWEGILLTNPDAIESGLDQLIAELSEFRRELTDPGLAERFRAAQTLHKKVRNL